MSCILGHYSNPDSLRSTLEAEIGREFTGARQNSELDHDTAGQWLINERDRRGSKVTHFYRNMNLEPYLWADVTAGNYDAELVQTFAMIEQEFGDRDYLLGIHHEQRVDTPVQPAVGTPAEYGPMFEHVATLARDHGVKKIACVPSMDSFLTTDEWNVGAFMPDPKFYDWLGCDFYNKIAPDGSLKRGTTAEEIEALADYADAHGLPWFFGEFGCAEHADKAEWLDNAMRRMRVRNCSALYITNKGDAGGGDMRPDSNPDALEVFKTWANREFFMAA